MKLILFAIIAFHFANFGEAQLVPDYCDCAVLWVRNIRDYMGLSNLSQCLVQNSLHSEMTGLIYQTWGQTGCPCDIDCLKNMFNVGHSFPYGPVIKLPLQILPSIHGQPYGIDQSTTVVFDNLTILTQRFHKFFG